MRPGPTHPILRLRRAETVGLCTELELRIAQDPSNADPRFRRNRVRHEVLPLGAGPSGGPGVVLALDEEGRILRSYHDPEGRRVDLAVVVWDDTVLVCPRDRAQDIVRGRPR